MVDECLKSLADAVLASLTQGQTLFRVSRDALANRCPEASSLIRHDLDLCGGTGPRGRTTAKCGS